MRSTSRATSRLSTPAIASGRAIESATDRRGWSELYGFWNTYWIESRCCTGRSRDDFARCSPSSTISPVHSWWRLPIERDNVLLPDPDSPTNATLSPRAMSNDTSCTTSVPEYAALTPRRLKAATSPTTWADLPDDRRSVRSGTANGWKQRTSCEPDALTASLGGNDSRHSAVATSHRSAKVQP